MPQINCPSAYIGESGRSLGDRVKEHFKAPSPIHLHSTTTGHPMDPEQFNIVHKEVNSHSRTIKEAMFIHAQDSTLNRNLGKYQLPHVWHLLNCNSSLPAFQPTPHPPKHPKQVPPSATHTGGGIHLFGKYPMLRSNPPQTPPKHHKNPYKLHPLQQHHLGKFLTFLFLSLTFLTDLMRWPW